MATTKTLALRDQGPIQARILGEGKSLEDLRELRATVARNSPGDHSFTIIETEFSENGEELGFDVIE